MALGVGGSDPQTELAALSDMTGGIAPITAEEYAARIGKAQALMQAQGLDAVYVHAGSSLYYFTGTRWNPSERMVGALIPARGPLTYIAPAFEENTLRDYWVISGEIAVWQEHENPAALCATLLAGAVTVGLDESTPFFLFDALRQAAPAVTWVNARPVTAGCRMQKSTAELALMQRAKDMTLRVHQAAARILRPGITTPEVADFIDRAHRAVGAAGSSFCIVLFGEATAYPHGVKNPQTLQDGDMVLIDTGCKLHGYNSDITRSYVYGTPTADQRRVWNHEKEAQARAFAAAVPGAPCGSVDVTARTYLEEQGYGPEYAVPGLPHRTGHGIGLDIHEWPYLVRNDQTPLAPGMCFSNEPMLCLYGKFGVRLEDHFYMTEDGPRWFTQPSHSLDDPFGYGA
ncbi:M24 family metallopeptidase [Novispirillum itersonii]|uniref:M24 family metallopeptidase n=1 Tax=Novispirillum itersonii TaxID=189 RepID=UPI00035D724D|nr:Xaa-Pro peptidase family protein [Novispirillum itersonii]